MHAARFINILPPINFLNLFATPLLLFNPSPSYFNPIIQSSTNSEVIKLAVAELQLNVKVSITDRAKKSHGINF